MKASCTSVLGVVILALVASTAAAQGPPDIRWMRGGHALYLTRLVASTDGVFFASAAQDDTVKIWRASDNQLLRTLLVPGVSTLALSPDNSTICANGRTPDLHPFVRCWHVDDGSVLWTVITAGGADALAFSADGQRLAVVDGHSLPILSVVDGSTIADFYGPAPHYGAGAISYSADGRFLATNTSDSQLALLDANTGAPLWSSGGTGVFGYDIAFSSDSQLVVSVNGNGAHVFGTTDHLARSFAVGSPSLAVAFSGDGTRLASGGYAGTLPFHSNLNLWNASTGALLRSWDGHGFPSGTSVPVTFSADSTKLLSGRWDIKRWKATDGAFDSLVTALIGPVRLLALSANDQVVAVATAPGLGSSASIDEHVISLFKAADGALLRYIDFGGQDLRGLALSPDGKHVAAADATGLRVWNVSTGALEHTRADASGQLFNRPLAYSPDGATIAIGGSGGVDLWTQATDSLTFVVPGAPNALEFLPDGHLAVALNNAVEIVTTGGALVRQMTDLSNVTSLDVSPDGTAVAAGGSDATFAPPYVARLWRVSDGSILRTLVGHTRPIHSVAFAWDGKTVISGAEDSSVRVWRVADASQARLYDDETYLTNLVSLDGVQSVVTSTRSARFIYGRGDATVVMGVNPDAEPAIKTFSVPTVTTGGCKAASAKIVLDRPAPPAGLTVSLASNSPDAAVPATLTFKSGASSKSFKINTSAVGALETATINATLDGHSDGRALSIRPIGIASLTLSPGTVTGGTSVTGTVSLECKATPGDIVVNLSSSIPSVALPEASVTIPQGARDKDFNITTVGVSATKKPTIKATTVPDAQSKAKKLVINP